MFTIDWGSGRWEVKVRQILRGAACSVEVIGYPFVVFEKEILDSDPFLAILDRMHASLAFC